MTRQRLDTRPIRRRWIAGTSTAADVAHLLQEVDDLRLEITDLSERLSGRRRVAAAALALDGPFVDTDPTGEA